MVTALAALTFLPVRCLTWQPLIGWKVACTIGTNIYLYTHRSGNALTMTILWRIIHNKNPPSPHWGEQVRSITQSVLTYCCYNWTVAELSEWHHARAGQKSNWYSWFMGGSNVTKMWYKKCRHFQNTLFTTPTIILVTLTKNAKDNMLMTIMGWIMGQNFLIKHQRQY